MSGGTAPPAALRRTRIRDALAGRSMRFILLYALAYAGLFVGFIPFFSLLLPARVEAVAAPGDEVALLGRITLIGALVASAANILFGVLTDRTKAAYGTRRPWIGAGLCGLALAYAAIAAASTGTALLAAVLAFQVALNMLFAPIIAIMADEVPDSRKGLVAGLTGTAQPFATLAGVAVTGLDDSGLRLAAVALAAMAMMAPLALFGREGSMRQAEPAADAARAPVARIPGAGRDLILAWTAKLGVQVAGTAVVTYLFFYLAGILRADGWSGAREERAIAWTMAVATLISVPLTLACGRLSDRIGRRKPGISAAAAAMTAGLALMATASSWAQAAAGYCLFAAAYSVFIALHTAFTMQLLPSPEHRGRDLGLFNLTNTLPSVAGPGLALLLVGAGGGAFSSLWLAAAALCALGGALTLLVRGQR